MRWVSDSLCSPWVERGSYRISLLWPTFIFLQKVNKNIFKNSVSCNFCKARGLIVLTCHSHSIREHSSCNISPCPEGKRAHQNPPSANRNPLYTHFGVVTVLFSFEILPTTSTVEDNFHHTHDWHSYKQGTAACTFSQGFKISKSWSKSGLLAAKHHFSTLLAGENRLLSSVLTLQKHRCSNDQKFQMWNVTDVTDIRNNPLKLKCLCKPQLLVSWMQKDTAELRCLQGKLDALHLSIAVSVTLSNFEVISDHSNRHCCLTNTSKIPFQTKVGC